MPTTYVNQVNSNPIYAARAEGTTKGVNIDTALEAIQGLIPDAATTSNQLADKNYVNSAVGASGSYEVASLTTGANPHPDVQTPSSKKIYLTKDAQSTATDPYTEWIYLLPVEPETVGTWEIIGETSVDLSGYKTVQTAVSDPSVPQSGTTESISFIDSITQNTNGVITPTKKNVKVTSSYIGTGDGSTDPANGQAIAAALGTLDVSDLVTSASGGAGKTLASLSETDGKINATFQDIEILSSKVTDRQTTAFDGTGANKGQLVTGEAAKLGIDAAIAELDVPASGTGAITGFGPGKTLATLTETDGKISATFQDISIANSQMGQGYASGTTNVDGAFSASITDYELKAGGFVSVRFSAAVPASATLNINSTGAKAIFYTGSALGADVIQQYDTATLVYDGTQYHLIAIDRSLKEMTEDEVTALVNSLPI